MVYASLPLLGCMIVNMYSILKLQSCRFLYITEHCYFSVMIVPCFATCKSDYIFAMRVYYDNS